MELASQIAQMILMLSILVTLHEWGHYITAKKFGVRVEKFFLFFDVNFALYKKKIGETVYGIGWLPLGGYVKLAGMIDESMDKEQMKQEPKPDEFRSKPAWQRLIVMLGGVTVNFILGILILATLLFIYGKEYLPMENVKYGIQVDSIAYDMGLRNGDKILTINGDKPKTLTDARLMMINIGKNDAIQVERLGKTQTIEVPLEAVQRFNEAKKKQSVLISLRLPAMIGGLRKDFPAEKAGLEIGDEIVTVNGYDIATFDELVDVLKESDYEKKAIDLTISRNGKLKDYSFSLKELDGRFIPGILPPNGEQLQKIYQFKNKEYSLLESIPAGFNEAWSLLFVQVKKMRQMLQPETKAWQQAGSIVSITKAFDPSWNWRQFFWMTAILSLILGFMNLLPIPALDGGHALFCIFEIISGKKPGDKFMEVIQTVGVVILLALMVFILGWDVIKNLFFT